MSIRNVFEDLRALRVIDDEHSFLALNLKRDINIISRNGSHNNVVNIRISSHVKLENEYNVLKLANKILPKNTVPVIRLLDLGTNFALVTSFIDVTKFTKEDYASKRVANNLLGLLVILKNNLIQTSGNTESPIDEICDYLATIVPHSKCFDMYCATCKNKLARQYNKEYQHGDFTFCEFRYIRQ